MVHIAQQTLRRTCPHHKIAMQYLFDLACITEAYCFVVFFRLTVLFLANFKCQHDRGFLKNWFWLDIKQHLLCSCSHFSKCFDMEK